MSKTREGNQGLAEQNMVLLPGAGIYAPKDLQQACHHSCLSAGMVFEAAPQACV